MLQAEEFAMQRFIKINIPTFLLACAACSNAPIQPPNLLPSITHIDTTAAKTAGHGKASIKILAQGKNAFVGLLKLDPGASVPEHRDSTEEYIYILAGSGTIYINDKAYTTSPGDAVYMPAHAKVRYQNGQDELVALQVFAGPEPAAKYDPWQIKEKPLE